VRDGANEYDAARWDPPVAHILQQLVHHAANAAVLYSEDFEALRI
jgi:hypothetical protein